MACSKKVSHQVFIIAASDIDRFSIFFAQVHLQ